MNLRYEVDGRPFRLSLRKSVRQNSSSSELEPWVDP